MRLGVFVGGAAIAAVVTVSTGCTTFQNRVDINKANELYKAQRYEEALPIYQGILQRTPDDWLANYLTAMSYIALYKPGSTHAKDKEYETKGLLAFEKLLTLKAPDEDQADKVRKYYLAFLDSSGQADKAIAFLEQELAKKPDNKELISQLAGMYQKKGDVQNWLLYLDKRAQLEPDNKEAWYSIAVACWARSYHGGATVSQDEREQVVARGLAAADKALAIEKEYLDAITYKNLLYREQAKAFANVGKNMEAGEAIMKAEELRNQALELRKKLLAQAPAKGKA
ncbi:MAG TPA: hypothetical protein VF139_03240 [Candidatus Polarisedimenticolaceae bacterium]